MQEKEEITPEQAHEQAQDQTAMSNAEQQEEVLSTTTPTEEDPLSEIKKQLDEAKSKYLYLFSDFENFRRNAARERIDLIQTAGREIITALLPLIDDFERADKNGAMTDGTTLIHNKLVSLLKTKGLHSLGTQAGESFDPDRHEAVTEIPAASEEMKGKIVDVLEQGYLLGERIIRFSKVVVGK